MTPFQCIIRGLNFLKNSNLLKGSKNYLGITNVKPVEGQGLLFSINTIEPSGIPGVLKDTVTTFLIPQDAIQTVRQSTYRLVNGKRQKWEE